MPDPTWALSKSSEGFTVSRPGGDAITLVTTGPRAGRIWARSHAGGSALIDDAIPALVALLRTAGYTVTTEPRDANKDGA